MNSNDDDGEDHMRFVLLFSRVPVPPPGAVPLEGRG